MRIAYSCDPYGACALHLAAIGVVGLSRYFVLFDRIQPKIAVS